MIFKKIYLKMFVWYLKKYIKKLYLYDICNLSSLINFNNYCENCKMAKDFSVQFITLYLLMIVGTIFIGHSVYCRVYF